MPPPNTLFSQADRDAVNRAVQDAEARTSAEIIPVVAASSGRYDRSEDIAGLWLGLAAFLVAWILVPQERQSGSWSGLSPLGHFLTYAASVVVGFVAGTLLASRIDWLRRLLTPRRQLRDEVELRARAVFYDHRVHHTQASSGVLLYVSLLERQATLLADQAVFDRLGQTVLNTLCAEFAGRLHSVSAVTALIETIDSLGTALEDHLPRSASDLNELPDALVLID